MNPSNEDKSLRYVLTRDGDKRRYIVEAKEPVNRAKASEALTNWMRAHEPVFPAPFPEDVTIAYEEWQSGH